MLAQEIGELQVRAAQALGRHAEVLAAASRARGGRSRFALEKAEALLEMMQYGEALRLVGRALRSRSNDPEEEARLRIVRARALWHIGGSARALAELRRAEGLATSALTRARALEEIGHLEWREQRFVVARGAADAALALYEEVRRPDGIVRALEAIAGIHRDNGRFELSLRAQGRRIESARATTRVDELARARADRGDLLAFLGRWEEAATDLDLAIELFRGVGDAREHTIARPRRAMVDLARGDLAGVELALARARECAFEAPRLRGEHHLLASDLYLASGDARRSEDSGREALQAFGSVRAHDGVCRAQIRVAHALVGQRRGREARAAARGALRCAPPERRDLRFLGLLALGRANLRLDAGAARNAFAEALRQGESRSGPVSAARLGIALTGRDEPGVRRALEELERWGDRRLLAFGLADAHELMPEHPALGTQDRGVADGLVTSLCPASRALADACAAILRGGGSGERLAAVMEALRPALGWHRAVWIGRASRELRAGSATVAMPHEGDIARSLATRSAAQPAFWDLTGCELGRHPTSVAHRLRAAFVAPARQDAWLYCDLRESPAQPSHALGLVAAAARLLGLAEAEEAPAPRADDPDASFPDLLGSCEGMRQVREAITSVGRSRMAVHVFGETGTGKERVAHALHTASGRRGPLVVVNAAQLDDGVFESQMFGHVKGSFTGAVTDHDGFVSGAHGGTLFLDEVTELSTRAQAKLLRFLETGEYVRMGENRPRRADVRILSAANVPVRDGVREQRFREDLMYRLVDYTITLPPLRERGDDVLALARHFLRGHADAEGRPCPRLGAAAAKALLSHAWPGNVRELRKQMHRAVVLAREGTVHPAQLQLQPAGEVREKATLREARAAFERELLERRLAEHGASRTRAAAALGITRQALALKMRQYGL